MQQSLRLKSNRAACAQRPQRRRVLLAKCAVVVSRTLDPAEASFAVHWLPRRLKPIH
jgi:hypothetical protein